MREARLENWYVIHRGDMYSPPEISTLSIGGKVYGHPDFEDGDSVVTSRVIRADGRKVMTSNTKYILGKVNKEYNEWYVEKYQKNLNEDSPFSFLDDDLHQFSSGNK